MIQAVKLSELLAESREVLVKAAVEDGRLDARLIVEHFSGTSRTDMIARPAVQVDAQAVEAIRQALVRRVAGEPVHRIIGFREFYGLKLHLSPETLEPRPDTETLVDAILPYLRQLAARQGACRILDLGTGTGAIALALLSELPGATALASDISADALATARRNAVENGLGERFTTIRSNWFEDISGTFHVIVSNPPYISSKELETLQCEVRGHDPARALDGGPDGLEPYRVIAAQAKAYLETGGMVAVEFGHLQKEDVERIFAESGFRAIEARKDLGGRDRTLIFQNG